MYIADDFNLNLHDNDKNRKIQNFLNLIYRNCKIPTINKFTRFTRKTATPVDHILTNSFFDTVTAILKTDISAHSLIYYLSQVSLPQENKDKNKITYNIQCIELSPLSRKYMKLIIMKLKLFKIKTKPVKPFYKNLSLYMITTFRKKK